MKKKNRVILYNGKKIKVPLGRKHFSEFGINENEFQLLKNTFKEGETVKIKISGIYEVENGLIKIK